MFSTPKLLIALMPSGYMPSHPQSYNIIPSAVEIVMGTLTQASDKFIPACAPTVVDCGILVYTQRQPYVTEISQGVNNIFRNIDYGLHVEKLRNYLTFYKRSIWLGTTRKDQFEILKKEFGDDVVTLSLNHTEDLIRNIAMDYIALTTYYKSTIFENETLDSLIYKLPKSFYHPADIEINLADVYDIGKLEKMLKDKFNEPLNDVKLKIYTEWKTQQELLRKKYENN